MDLARQYRFQITDSKGGSGGQIRRTQNPDSRLQIGSRGRGGRLQITEYRENDKGRVAGGDYRYRLSDTGEGREGQYQKSRKQIPDYGLQ